jgi:hypothetical protein
MKRSTTVIVLMAALLGGVGLAAAEEPHARAEPHAPSGGHPPAPSGRPGGPAVDGRGQVLDSRYNHGGYYPPMGTTVRSLPGGYRPYYHGGQHYYFTGGVWYAPRGPGFVVIVPPPGLVISVLPPYYSTVWFGGIPYYYADNVYYTWQPDQNGYVVAPPPEGAAMSPDGGDGAPGGDAPAGGPPGAPSGPGGPPAGSSDLIIYPKSGQSKDQQAADEYECHNWARSQTGFDPTQPNGGVAANDADRSHSNYERAMAACLQGRGYQVN